MDRKLLEILSLPKDTEELLANAPLVTFAHTLKDLEKAACGSEENTTWSVSYTLPDGREVLETEVVRVKNGVRANYIEAYMRRRDREARFRAGDLDSKETVSVKTSVNLDTVDLSVNRE